MFQVHAIHTKMKLLGLPITKVSYKPIYIKRRVIEYHTLLA